MTDIVRHYSDLLKQHGDDPRAVHWSDRDSQRRRFSTVTEPLANAPGSSVMDVGCGLAHLAEFLGEVGFDGTYTGIDINPDFISACREKLPSTRFACLDIGLTVPGWESDFVVCSGLFNNPSPDPQALLHASLRNMYAVTRQALSFNLMSTYVDFLDPGLVYFNPEDVFRFCKEELSPLVALQHDYQVKPGVVPFEFTVHVSRTGEACRPRMTGTTAPAPAPGPGPRR